MLPNYYQVLDIEQNASEHDIRHSFRMKLKQLHPDFNPSPNAKEQFTMVHEAYEILIHPNTRSLYDEDLATGKNPADHFICAKKLEVAKVIALENMGLSFENLTKSSFYKDTDTMDISMAWVLILFGLLSIGLPMLMFNFFEKKIKQPALGFGLGFLGVLLGMVFLSQGYMTIKSYAKSKKKISR